MISITVLLWIFVIIFAVIGAMRGWAKEILVTFGVILSIFLLTLVDKFAPGLQKTLIKEGKETFFWVQFALTAGFVIFGYQSPSLPRISESPRLIRGSVQDIILGVLFGSINGFLIFGTIWFYLHDAGYPLDYILSPEKGTALGDAALKMIKYLPPAWLGAPTIYFAVAIAFGLILVLFI